jgi:hypothetical protein
MADSTVHVAIQIDIRQGHCILVLYMALNIIILLAAFSSRKFIGWYNSHKEVSLFIWWCSK